MPRTCKGTAHAAVPTEPTPLQVFIAADNAKRRKQPKTEFQKLTTKEQREHLENAYLASLKAYPDLPMPRRQVSQLVAGHRYRADFCWHPRAPFICEVDGGAWLGGRGGHTSAAGMERDRRRDAECWLAGWTVLRVTAAMIADGSAARYTRQYYERLSQRRQGVA